MKITFKMLDGRVLSRDFASVDEFLTLQSREVPAIDDSARVVEWTADGVVHHFSGNLAGLYFELSKGL